MSEWQMIETAPRDGTQVLLFPQYCVAHWDFGDESWMLFVLPMSEFPVSEDMREAFYCVYPSAVHKTAEPTHWMHLPKPPQPTETK